MWLAKIDGDYRVFERKEDIPKLNWCTGCGTFHSGDPREPDTRPVVASFCAPDFERLTGHKLEEGQAIQFSLQVIGQVEIMSEKPEGSQEEVKS